VIKVDTQHKAQLLAFNPPMQPSNDKKIARTPMPMAAGATKFGDANVLTMP